MHDRDKGGHQHTPYSRRSKREKTGTILAKGAENYTVTCTKEEKVANEMDTNPGEAPNDHNQMVPDGNTPDSVGINNPDSRFDIDPRLGEVERKIGPMDELEEVCIDEKDTTKVIRIGKNLEAAV